MPIDYRQVDGGLGNVITASGVVTEEEFIGFYTDFFSQDEKSLANYRFGLSVYSAVAELHVNVDSVKRVVVMSTRTASIIPDTLVAICAPQTYAYGLARMWEVFLDVSNWETRVFKDRDEAVSWLRKRAKEKYGIAIIDL